MQRCPKCATENNDGRSFCTNCGAGLWAGAPAPGASPSGVAAFFAVIGGLVVGTLVSAIASIGVYTVASQTPGSEPRAVLLVEVVLLVLAAVGLWAVLRAGVKRLTAVGFAFLVAGSIAMLGGFALCSAFSITPFVVH